MLNASGDILQKMKGLVFKYGVYFVLVAMIIVLSLSIRSFLTPRNILNVLRQISMNTILACGMTFVIISNGIDLSVASTVSLAGVIACLFAHPGEYPFIISMVVVLLLGFVVGGINGVIISHTGVPAFIVTLGTQQVVRGIAFIITNGSSVINLSNEYRFIGQGVWLGIPFPIYILAIIFVISYIFLHKTKFGRYVYAVGGNDQAANVSGINVKRIRVLVYIIASIFAAIVGVILSSRTNSANPNAGMSYELDAIAAVVIGGTSMSGGKGVMLGTVIGALMIGILNNGLDLIQVSSYLQQVIKGIVIIGAVMLDRINEVRK
ncbi:MAG: ABC transporter permease [Treponema sp.]|jgi:ribose/xylose/arabinose/galactoside ABC-type transport system permease subunit|nr:ABC transporter permease [Treponema sp.]